MGEKQGKVPDSNARETAKLSPHQAQLEKYEDEAIPLSFESKLLMIQEGKRLLFLILVLTIPC